MVHVEYFKKCEVYIIWFSGGDNRVYRQKINKNRVFTKLLINTLCHRAGYGNVSSIFKTIDKNGAK